MQTKKKEQNKIQEKNKIRHRTKQRQTKLIINNVKVVSTLQKLTIKGAATKQGQALDVGEGRKRGSHSSSCHSFGISFAPLVVETLADTAAVKQWRLLNLLVAFEARDLACLHQRLQATDEPELVMKCCQKNNLI